MPNSDPGPLFVTDDGRTILYGRDLLGDGGGAPPPPSSPGLASGKQSPDNGRMEARIAKLEELAQETRERFARMETKIDHIDKEASQFKWWVVAQIAAGMLAVVGTGIAIQQMTVATFQGAAQVAKDAASAPAAQPAPIIINVPAQATPAKP